MINNTIDSRYNLTIDLGIGPDIVATSNFSETALDSTIETDDIFAGKTSVSLAAMAGIGIRFNHVFGKHAVECGYRFMYLGPAALKSISSDTLNTLTTGNNYANAVICGISL